MNDMRTVLQVPHIIRGRVLFGDEVEHTTRIGERFRTPHLDLDQLVVPRSEPEPAFDVPLEEILDFLHETGRRLVPESNPFLAEALDLATAVSPHSRRVIENCYRDLPAFFDRDALGYQVERELGVGTLDGWMPVYRPGKPTSRIRAFPPRLVHVMPGNSPAAAAITIARSAVTKGIHLLKLPSNDLYTATAILRTMAAVDPHHPTLRSFSAAYWRGGDKDVEGTLFRSQYFDKLVAWGGADTIRHAVSYLGPGFELVAFDPKVSVSFIGKEAFVDDDTLERVAALAADDSTMMNQEACASSRFHFVEGTIEQVDSYCERLARSLSLDRPWADGKIWRTPADIREPVDILRHLDSHGVWGDYEGHGLVIRSDEPVDFHPIAKTVNVIHVSDLADALPHVTVATQTVSIFPAVRQAALRDRLARAGAQRVVALGASLGWATAMHGLPHDGSFALQRMVRWVSDET